MEIANITEYQTFEDINHSEIVWFTLVYLNIFQIYVQNIKIRPNAKKVKLI